jgi:hypothetical protein
MGTPPRGNTVTVSSTRRAIAARLPRAWAALVLVGVVQLSACDDTIAPVEVPKLVPAPPPLPRLTRTQYDNAITDVFGTGLTLPSSLEPDVPFDYLPTVGASVAKVSPRGVELYEEAARQIAAQVAGKPDRLAQLAPCKPSGAEDAACLGQFVDAVAPRLWRRAMLAGERDALVARGVQAGKSLGTFAQACEYVLVSLLQHPAFLYRVEVGEVDPAVAGGRRLTAYELAARVAAFLTNGPPDAPLLQAAADGSLHQPAVLAAQVDRLLGDPRARRAVRNFATEWLQLGELDKLSKDPKVYKHFSADLGEAAREETLRLVDQLAFADDADFRTLLTTRDFYVDRRLAAIYEVAAPADEGHHRVTLPASHPRRGLLGQVSVLAMASHAITTSPTLRGIFVRKHLLCDEVPPPPANLNTAIPEVNANAKTMRQRLMAHMEVSYCAGCHKTIDPIGFAFEHFDGVGRYRETDQGEKPDTTGDLDGATFVDLASLSSDVAASPKFPRCLVQKLYAYAVSRPLTDGEKPQLDSLAAQFRDGGYRLKALMRAVALSPGMRRVGDVQVGGAP